MPTLLSIFSCPRKRGSRTSSFLVWSFLSCERSSSVIKVSIRDLTSIIIRNVFKWRLGEGNVRFLLTLINDLHEETIREIVFAPRRGIHVDSDAVSDESSERREVEFLGPNYALIKFSSERLNYSSRQWRQVIESMCFSPASSPSRTQRSLRTREIIDSRRPSDHLTRHRNSPPVITLPD